MSGVIATVAASLALAFVLWIVRSLQKQFRDYVEQVANPEESASLRQRVDEACELSARAVVAATRAEASAKRTESKLDDLAMAMRAMDT